MALKTHLYPFQLNVNKMRSFVLLITLNNDYQQTSFYRCKHWKIWNVWHYLWLLLLGFVSFCPFPSTADKSYNYLTLSICFCRVNLTCLPFSCITTSFSKLCKILDCSFYSNMFQALKGFDFWGTTIIIIQYFTNSICSKLISWFW